MNITRRMVSTALALALSGICLTAASAQRRSARQGRANSTPVARRPAATAARGGVARQTGPRLTGTYRLDPSLSDDPRAVSAVNV